MRINLVILWHMHQPQYRDPATGQYMLPWTRLHALKDYWGMVRVLGEFPRVHATFNFVPLLAEQIEEYASGRFKEEWFEIAFAPADSLTPAIAGPPCSSPSGGRCHGSDTADYAAGPGPRSRPPRMRQKAAKCFPRGTASCCANLACC